MLVIVWFINEQRYSFISGGCCSLLIQIIHRMQQGENISAWALFTFCIFCSIFFSLLHPEENLIHTSHCTSEKYSDFAVFFFILQFVCLFFPHWMDFNGENSQWFYIFRFFVFFFQWWDSWNTTTKWEQGLSSCIQIRAQTSLDRELSVKGHWPLWCKLVNFIQIITLLLTVVFYRSPLITFHDGQKINP